MKIITVDGAEIEINTPAALTIELINKLTNLGQFDEEEPLELVDPLCTKQNMILIKEFVETIHISFSADIHRIKNFIDDVYLKDYIISPEKIPTWLYTFYLKIKEKDILMPLLKVSHYLGGLDLLYKFTCLIVANNLKYKDSDFIKKYLELTEESAGPGGPGGV